MGQEGSCELGQQEKHYCQYSADYCIIRTAHSDNMNYIDTDHIGAADAKPINSHAEWNDEVVFSTIRC